MAEKFCFGCARYWKEEQLTKVKRGKATRMMCPNCIANTSGSWFSKRRNNETDSTDPAVVQAQALPPKRKTQRPR